MSQDHFLQAATHITRVVHRRRSVLSAMGGLRASPALHSRAVTGAPDRPQCRLPKSLCLAPSSRCLLRNARWHRPGCVPPLTIAGFEQRILNGHGSAQVGFGFMHTSFLGLTVYSRASARGRLSPEPLRLTRPFRAAVLVGPPTQGGASPDTSGLRSALGWFVLAPSGRASKRPALSQCYCLQE